MKFITKIKDYISELTTRQLYYSMLVFSTSLIFIIGFLFYNYFSRVQVWQKKIKNINNLRMHARTLLEKNEIVKQQRAQVEEELTQDKTFTLKNYFMSVLQELNLASFLAKEPMVSEPEIIDADYAEIKLDANLMNINTKQLSDLLENLEKNKRIALKELVINKPLKAQTIDVTLVIATLQPKSATS
ncbi:MAG: hypothetical protein WA432_04215 [Candidatus Babeliaceae bacterium]